MASFMFLKKCCFLFLLISASFSSTCSAGRQLRSVNNLEKEAMASTYKGHQQLHQGEELNIIHGRLLRVNTKDYGNYDPAPTFVKPPFKLIPN
ncbi:protein CASPARIAN STRIP INTEGRITY FACTOR 1-like [Apium graveolens]|uniref:protein CASPARIAN STRIP INTEGRITY FACTOR 1-like n=1 Tax=Apium graveolens TaxID=4045 RepID=UPI003D7A6316